jgi:hypothetical protein
MKKLILILSIFSLAFFFAPKNVEAAESDCHTVIICCHYNSGDVMCFYAVICEDGDVGTWAQLTCGFQNPN